ncbi:Arm DNA-binding domain-containing protein [Asticcacaulis excentricus]|uniref:Arm DNA-binding domain-containing protein n=1 Tax=Asticcacaulis excentricus TaxID=78587 RepID=UPI002F9548C2
MSLVVTQLRNAKPAAKPYKLTDEKGLFLLVQPSGGMLWRFKYRYDGRDETGQTKRIEKKHFMKFSSSRNRDLNWKIPVLNGLDFWGACHVPTSQHRSRHMVSKDTNYR